MPIVTINNRNVSYEWLGKHDIELEPTLVMLSQELRNAEVYRTQFASLAVKMNVLCIDNTNTGLSSRLDRPLSVEELIDETRQVLTIENVRRPLFYGICSTVDIASRCASSIGGGTVLVSGVFRYRMERWLDLLYQVTTKHIKAKDTASMAELLLLLAPGSKAFGDTHFELMAEKHRIAARMEDPGYLWASTQYKANLPFDRALFHKINGPILLIKGEYDPFYPVSILREAFAGIEHQLEVLDSGHRLLDDKPDDVLRIIGELMYQHRTTKWGVIAQGKYA